MSEQQSKSNWKQKLRDFSHRNGVHLLGLLYCACVIIHSNLFHMLLGAVGLVLILTNWKRTESTFVRIVYCLLGAAYLGLIGLGVYSFLK